jgi:hypothetical protein
LKEAAMDGTAAIHNNLEALKRILAGLVAMAGLAGALTSPLCGLRDRSSDRASGSIVCREGRGDCEAIGDPGKIREASGGGRNAAGAAGRAAATARPRTLSLPLLDPLRRPVRGNRRYVPAHAAPRILFPGVTKPFSLPPPPSPDDPIDASRLSLRLAALAVALDDLQGQAKRFARWKARGADAAGAQSKDHDIRRKAPASGRIRRISPLRSGRPPGGRLTRFEPSAKHPRDIREVDEVLAHAHALARYALEKPDTS